MGSWVELARFDPTSGQWDRLLNQGVRDVLDDDGGLLVGSVGLCQLRGVDDCLPVAGFPAPTAEVLMLHRDASAAVWAGTDHGLFRRDPDGQWSSDARHPGTVRTALETADGRLILGSNGNGLLVLPSIWNPGESLHSIGPEAGLGSDFVRSLLSLEDGRILVGTEDAGLCLLDAGLQVRGCIGRAEGLPHHSAHFMILDEAERLWVNTNAGIYWAHIEDLLAYFDDDAASVPNFYRLGQRHGLLNLEGNGGVYRAGARSSDGRLWFPNQRGLVQIDSTALFNNYGEALTTRAIVAGHDVDQRIDLPARARNLDLSLTAIALAEPENVQFRYRFTGDERWAELSHQRSLSFRDLRPGSYQLEISARYVNGGWTGPSQILEIKADHRLHEHPLVQGFAVLAGFFAMGGVWVVGRRRQHRLRQQVQERSVHLEQATRQVASLSDSFQQLDIQHRTALHAVSRELRQALSAALQPLLAPAGGRAKRSPETADIRERSRILETLLDQVGSFAEIEPGSTLGETHANAGSSSGEPVIGDDTVDLVALVRMEVLLHLSDPDFAVDQLAARLGMSRSVLYRQLAAVTDIGPAELIRDVRLEEACNQLRDSELRISCIAFATGFRSVSAFSRAFARKTGQSPREWRQQNAANKPKH